MTLSRRLLLLMLAVLLPTAGLFAWIVVAAYERELESSRQHLRETVHALALVVDRELDKRAAIARTLAVTSGLIEGDHRRFQDEALAATEGTGDWVLLMDPTTQLVNTSLPFGTPLPRRTWHPSPPWEDNPAPQAAGLGMVDREPLLAVFVPVPHVVPAHFTVGVVFRPSALQSVLVEQHLPEGWIAGIVDADQTVVARAPAPERAFGRRVNDAFLAALARRPEGFFDTVSLDNVPVRTYYSRSPGYGWTMAISVPLSQITAGARRAAWAVSIGAAALSLFALALALWGARRIGRPIQALERAAHELARDRVPEFAPTGLVEADAVGAALRRAGEQSAQINEELERRVAAALDAARAAQARSDELQRALAEELLHLITDNLPVLISYVDREGRYRLNNRPYEQWFGRSRSEILGHTMRELLGEENWSRVEGRMARALQGEIALFEVELVYPVVGRRWVEITYIPHRAPDGSVAGVAVLVHDMTATHTAREEVRESRNELRRLNEELAAADRRKDEFLATLAHELRNPLAPITNALEVLRLKDPVDPDLRWTRDIIDRQVRQMTRLVDDLLDVARITRGRIDLRLERVDAAAVVHGAVEAARPLIEDAGHSLLVRVPGEPLWLDADPTRLTQVLSNLLTNAAKYTPRGGRIEIAAAAEAKDVVITVRDNGIGLAPEHLQTVFEMFSQVAPALERSQGGLGIGLALARGLVELHGGRIASRSAGAGRGSEFEVRLPMTGAGPAAATRAGTVHEVPRSQLRVLVVDDNQDAADSLAMVLRLSGHEAVVAHDGPDALAQAGSFSPDLVLLDIGMPGMNGYEVARRLRAGPQGTRMVLAALTGWGQAEDKQRAHEAGFDHHLTKPVDNEHLEVVLAATVARLQAAPGAA